MTDLRDDLVLIEHSDPWDRIRLSRNSYAVLRDGGALLIDTGFLSVIPFVRTIAERGFAPEGLFLSHRHLARNGDAVRSIAGVFKIPVLLHPLDAVHPQAAMRGIGYEDPTAHPLLARFALAAIHCPGHTEGSVMLYGKERGGVLFTGDSAMGMTTTLATSGIERLVRPPDDTSVDPEQLKERWRAFDRPVATVLPYHGTGYVGRAGDLAFIMRPLTRPQPTVWRG